MRELAIKLIETLRPEIMRVRENSYQIGYSEDSKETYIAEVMEILANYFHSEELGK